MDVALQYSYSVMCIKLDCAHMTKKKKKNLLDKVLEVIVSWNVSLIKICSGKVI